MRLGISLFAAWDETVEGVMEGVLSDGNLREAAPFWPLC